MFAKLKEIFKRFIGRVKAAYKNAFQKEKPEEKEIEGYDLVFIKDGKVIDTIKTNDEKENQLKNYSIALKYLTGYTVETVYQLHKHKVLIYVKSVKNDIKEVVE